MKVWIKIWMACLWYAMLMSVLTAIIFMLIGMVFVANKAVGAEFTVVANHSPAGKYCAFPGACRMADGRIICVFYAGLGHVTTTNQRKGGGAIAYTISEDDGDTWSEPEVLLDTELDDRDPSISLLRDGRLILTYFRLITVPKLAGDGVYIAEIVGGLAHRKDDAGLDVNLNGHSVVKTASPSKLATGTNVRQSGVEVPRKDDDRIGEWVPAHIRKLQHDAGCSSPIRDFGNGHLLLGSYHIEQPYVIRSTDNGVTWQVFDIPNGGKHLDAETDVIQVEWMKDPVVRGNGMTSFPGKGTASMAAVNVPQGETSERLRESRFTPLFYAVMRGTNCNGHYSTSSDGKNWTTAKDIGFVLHSPVLHRVELGGNKGSALLGDEAAADDSLNSGAPHSAILLAHRVPATAMHYSLDECETWKGPIQVDSCGGAYPCFVTCKDGSVLIIYYTEGTNSDIRCRRFGVTQKGIQWQN